MAKEKDYIGFDALAWVQRLIDVAEGSQFTEEQKKIIDKNLRKLFDDLK